MKLQLLTSVSNQAIDPAVKTLFLDFDGVLHPVEGKAFVHVPVLAAALEGHDVQIVVTSSFRIHQPLDHILTHLGPLGPRVVGTTPLIDRGKSRQHEIDAWIAGYGVEDYRVLDDDSRLFTEKWAPLILCDGRKGLDKYVIDLLMLWLNKSSL